ncbi:hypothetical protein SJAG_01633 [Schizosaccharomyces japonicus yFS275]|uniref:Tethering factor Uso1 n=1 Tax=Schizosaccharomyces japonicus (strain yFS275 / FY16936) TaxID=402676 RepID=B6JYH1_SCHJY|nr:hypothetical protein SJAG_01633 [Schizosaccharomyces japonicus yFS275]EEB06589.2 hypothetical protein SJAG_01633 [Schizosaccharomyces japonicus yFS275]
MDILQKGYNVILAPPKVQQADETISKLCDRLEHATLFEDRKAAILGLKSFSKSFKELVAAQGLRGIIQSLQRDKEDVEILRASLETCLVLMSNDDEDQLSDTALWVADQFILQPDNINELLENVQSRDFFVQLYSIEVFSCVLVCRPAELQDILLKIPAAIATLLRPLSDSHDALRNATLHFFIKLVSHSPNLQKVAAFENAFDYAFDIYQEEGGIIGGMISLDCLKFISLLLEENSSNQNYFREMNLFPKIAYHLNLETINDSLKLPRCADNVIALLKIIRLLAPLYSLSSRSNQLQFMRCGVIDVVLRLAFGTTTFPTDICVEAWTSLAHIVHANADTQLAVYQNGYFTVYDLDAFNAFLHVIYDKHLEVNHRYAAVFCLRSLTTENDDLKNLFLEQTLKAYANHDDGQTNLLETYLSLGLFENSKTYECWFTSVILSLLIFDSPERKKKLCSVTIHCETDEEEAVTFIQTLSTKLIAVLRHNDALQTAVGYLMLLILMMANDADCVNDFLSEGSVLQMLVGTLIDESSSANATIQGLIATLLAVVYYYCPENSPISKSNIYGIIDSMVKRDIFVHRLLRLRQSEQIRDFVSFDQDNHCTTLLFDDLFINFFKDNFERIKKAIDTAATEFHVEIDGVKIHDLLDHARQELRELRAEKESMYEEVQNLTEKCDLYRKQSDAVNSKLESLQTESSEQLQAYASELEELRNSLHKEIVEHEVNKSTVKSLEDEILILRKGHEDEIKGFTEENMSLNDIVKDLKTKLTTTEQYCRDATAKNKSMEKELKALEKQNERYRQDIETTKQLLEKSNAKLNAITKQLNDELQENEELKKKNIFFGLAIARSKQCSALEETLKNKELELSSLKDTTKNQQNELRLSKKKYKEATAAVDELKTKNTDNLKKEEALEKRVNELEGIVAKREDEMNDLNTQLENLNAMKKENSELKLKNLDLQSELTSVKELKDATEKENNELRKSSSVASNQESEFAKLKTRIQEMEAALKEAENTAQALTQEKDNLEQKAKESDESWLLILEEMENKRKRDRERLKELGQEVSEDEDSAEEDDEEANV